MKIYIISFKQQTIFLTTLPNLKYLTKPQKKSILPNQSLWSRTSIFLTNPLGPFRPLVLCHYCILFLYPLCRRLHWRLFFFSSFFSPTKLVVQKTKKAISEFSKYTVLFQISPFSEKLKEAC